MSQEERSIFWEVIVSIILSKNVYMNMCPIPNDFRDRAIWMYNRKFVDKNEILRVRTVSNTGIYCSSDRFGTVYNKYSKIPPSTSVHFATRVKTWRVVRLSASWPFFMQAITSSMLTSSSSRVSTFFCTLHSSSNPISKNLTGLSLKILVYVRMYVCIYIYMYVYMCVCVRVRARVCVKRGPSEFSDLKFTGVMLRSILIFITRKFLIKLSTRHGQLRRWNTPAL